MTHSKKLLIASILSALALGGASAAPAQPPGRMAGPGGGMMLSRADTNGDGKITRAEMRAQADQRFDRLDTNRDGAIDPAELRAAVAAGGPGMGRRGWRDQPLGEIPPPPPPPPPAAPKGQ